MFTKNDIHTLMDVVIVNVVIAYPTQVDLHPWSCTIQKFIAFDTTQAKKKELLQRTPYSSNPPFNDWNI